MNANNQTPLASGSADRSFRLRFSLRTLFLLTGLICIACWAIPASVRWKEWHDVKHHLESAKSLFHTDPTTHRSYAFLFRKKQYYLTPDTLFLNDKSVDTTPEALFLAPLNIRVTSTAEAMSVLNNDLRKADEMGFILWETTPNGKWQNALNLSKFINHTSTLELDQSNK
ncbi:MAG: hypothetical protein GXP26_10935 [Planctomycetes bacterium]|nr:hypothetical protein [Planctomycetota bacterium]